MDSSYSNTGNSSQKKKKQKKKKKKKKEKKKKKNNNGTGYSDTNAATQEHICSARKRPLNMKRAIFHFKLSNGELRLVDCAGKRKGRQNELLAMI